MKLSTRVLGAHTVAELSARTTAPLLVIGSDIFYRGDLAGVGCFNFIAAAHLSAALHSIGVANTRDVFDNVAPSSLVMPSIGAVSLAVLGAAFEARKLGGDQPLEAWVLKHRGSIDSKKEIVTFDTLKEKERKREAGEVKARAQRKRRAHARRNVAHETRVQRFNLRRTRSTAHAPNE